MTFVKLLEKIVLWRGRTLKKKKQEKSALQIAIETELSRLKREHTPLSH